MKHFMYLLTSNISQSIISVVTTAFLARLIAPSDFGVMSIAMVFIGLLEVLSNSGIGSTIIQKESLSKKDIYTANTISLLFSIISSIFFLFLIPFISFFFSISNLESTLYDVSVIIPATILTQVPYAILVRENKFKKISIINVISFLSFSITSLIFAFFGFGLFSLIIGQIVRFYLKFIIYQFSYLSYNKFRYNFDKDFIKKYRTYGKDISIGVVINFLSRRFDNFFIGKFFGEVNLAYYTKSYGLMELSINPIGKVYQLFFFKKIAHANNLKHVKKEFLDSLEIALWIFIPISFIVYFSAKDLILFFLGSNWLSSEELLKILSLSIPFRFMIKIANSVFKGTGKSKVFQNFQIIYFSMILLVLLFFKDYNFSILIYSISFVSILQGFVMIGFCFRILKIRLSKNLHFFKFPLIIFFLNGVLNFINTYYIDYDISYIKIFVTFLISFISPIILFLFVKNINPRIFNLRNFFNFL